MRTLRKRLRAATDEPLQLVNDRVYKVEGRGRTGFAVFQATRLKGPVFWIVLAHDRDRPMPGSLPDGVTKHLHFIEARDEADLLWTVEESQRARPVAPTGCRAPPPPDSTRHRWIPGGNK